MNLKQKNGVALITGASTGIGATRADGLAQERRGTTILQSVLAALNEGKISEAVDQFDERFTFTDHALDLKFTDKGRLIEFFQKTRELFPDTVLEVDSTFQCGNHAVAEWKLTATTQTLPYGSKRFRFPNFVARHIDRAYRERKNYRLVRLLRQKQIVAVQFGCILHRVD
jgi:NAD(P)-dependent dehydrogenase (short-subunit alcohol dehydrogenase family)